MSYRQQIALAVANGCTNIEQVAQRLSLPKDTILHISAETDGLVKVGFGDTLQLDRRAAILKHKGQIVSVMRADVQ